MLGYEWIQYFIKRVLTQCATFLPIIPTFQMLVRNTNSQCNITIILKQSSVDKESLCLIYSNQIASEYQTFSLHIQIMALYGA